MSIETELACGKKKNNKNSNENKNKKDRNNNNIARSNAKSIQASCEL